MCFMDPALIEGTPPARQSDMVLGVLQGVMVLSVTSRRGCVLQPWPSSITWGNTSGSAECYLRSWLLWWCRADWTCVQCFAVAQFNTQQYTAQCWGMVWGLPHSAMLHCIDIRVDLEKRIRQKQSKHKNLQCVFSPRAFSYVGLNRM